MAEGKGRVCVTGGTGYLGSWIVKRLLEDGYAVNTTVRYDPERKRDFSFLTNLPGASQKLKIFNADLSNPESFSAAIEGCIGVFHTATPIDFDVNEITEEIVTKRTIDGALGILKACLDSKTVKRVVYTSSATAEYWQAKQDDVMDESYWSDVNFLRTQKPFAWSYAVSKTLTEKAVLEFGEKHGLDVVTIIPTNNLGPFICPKLPGSIYGSLAFLFGDRNPLVASRYHMVHIDDTARAHVFLFEHPNPKGRYNCSLFSLTIEEVAELLSSKYPEFPIPTLEELNEIKNEYLPHLTPKKLIDAGFEFKYSFEEMIDDTIQCCKEKGYL